MINMISWGIDQIFIPLARLNVSFPAYKDLLYNTPQIIIIIVE
jgi:hypothetical protein